MDEEKSGKMGGKMRDLSPSVNKRTLKFHSSSL